MCQCVSAVVGVAAVVGVGVIGGARVRECACATPTGKRVGTRAWTALCQHRQEEVSSFLGVVYLYIPPGVNEVLLLLVITG